jgi:hypothetical protein
MNTIEISNFLKSNANTKQFFIGVFAKNQIKDLIIRKSPFCLVINTDNSDQPGTHWVAIWGDKDCSHFFDSYGTPPVAKEFSFFLQKHSTCIQYNNIRL